MTITRVKLENFTVFESLDLEPSPGINVLVGANGTGKTHLMKVCYAACDVSYTGDPFAAKLNGVFLPSGNPSERLKRLVNRSSGSETAEVRLSRVKSEFSVLLPWYMFGSTTVKDESKDWTGSPIECVYIPAKDMLANAPGFRSLYARREIHLEETYKDILDLAYLDSLRNPEEFVPSAVTERLEAELGGKVITHGEERR